MNTTTRLISVISIFILLFVLIIVIKGWRAGVWLVDIKEEHENRQEVVPKREKTA